MVEEPCCAEQWLAGQPHMWTCEELYGEPGRRGPLWCCKIVEPLGKVAVCEVGSTRSEAATRAVRVFGRLYNDLLGL